MADDLDIEAIFKLKVDGLKQELEKRKLPKYGTKAELQERLLNHLTTNDISAITNKDEPLDDTTEDEELNKEIEESLDKIDTPTVLGDENQKFLSDDVEETPVLEETPVVDKNDENETTEQEKTTETTTVTTKNEQTEVNSGVEQTEQKIENKPSVKKIALTESEKIEQRSKRFGATVSYPEKKKSRLERFGDVKSDAKPIVATDKLAKRAARFGNTDTTVISDTSSTTNSFATGGDKIKKRQERFLDDKIKKRQERFGVVQSTSPVTDLDERKKQRALKFGVK